MPLLLQTAWGSHKTTAAVRRMLQRGLADPFAQQFLLLSETGDRCGWVLRCFPGVSGNREREAAVLTWVSQPKAYACISDPVWRWRRRAAVPG